MTAPMIMVSRIARVVSFKNREGANSFVSMVQVGGSTPITVTNLS